jgi:glycosyltransferase involved in cell wall biosynthesis
MATIERATAEQAEIQRLANRLAIQSSQRHHLEETLAAIEASNAWAVARRLSQWRRRLLPEGSRRQHWFRVVLRGLRLWQREGVATLLRRFVGKVRRRLRRLLSTPSVLASAESVESLHFATPSNADALRIAFIGSSAECEAQSMRYRAHNVLEALALVGVQGLFTAQEEVPDKLSAILSHDLIVLVRSPQNAVSRMVIDAAHRLGRPVVFDIDDYLFDAWILPYVEAFRGMPRGEALRILDEIGDCLQACDYFTGSTSYLAEKAAALGKPSFVLPNGLNATQLDLAHRALRQRADRRPDGLTRFGYFSGTRTHQADFRVVYPALMSVLRQYPQARLVLVGDLDVGEFPGLALHVEQIETLPFRHWTKLPEAMADIDINLIPLEPTPFNEAKSNLKYFEAGLLKVPSIASPTHLHRGSIVHGHNGLLATTPHEWHDCLIDLLLHVERRARLGQNAFEQVVRTYTPLATATEAAEVYRRILLLHRAKRAA